jgi:hypothetical protein
VIGKSVIVMNSKSKLWFIIKNYLYFSKFISSILF